MKISNCGFSLVAAALVGISLVGCESSSAGGGDMDELARRVDKPEPKPPAPAPEPTPEPTPPPVAETPQPPAQPENETTITITVKNPQGLVPAANQALNGNQNPQAAPQGAAPQNGAPLQAVDTKGTVGKRGYRNTVDGPLRYYGAVASARNVMEDRLLGAQIQKSLDLYVAGNDGKYPKSSEEFMEKIINENMIQLPELRPGQEFFYDPEDHELKIGELVDEPAPATQPPAAQ